jgi:hypothetical protein
MGVEHLQGMRTGRPKGSKTSPAWVRALGWAERNLDNTDAVPPSALSGRLLAFGREQPDKFLACLARRDAWTASRCQPRRVKVLNAPLRQLAMCLANGGPLQCLRDVPGGFAVVGCTVETAMIYDTPQWVLQLMIESEAFPEVQAGEPIPKLVL